MAEPVGFFVLRTPLLPFGELEGLSRGKLVEWVKRPEVREALFVASPSLEADLDTWLREPTTERGQKIERSLVRYACRMAGRATPFGLFAGCSLGTIADATNLELDTRRHRHTRLDMYYACELADAIARAPEMRDALVYRTSSSAYRAAGQLYWVEGRSVNGAREYHLSAVERAPHLDATLARAEAGATRAALAAALVADDAEIELDEAARYVDQLVDEQLLVPELAPAVTGRESVAAIIDELAAIPAGAALAAPLRTVTARLAELDAGGLGHPPSVYRELAAALAPLPVVPELPRLFQVDMVKSSPAATLGRDVVRELERAIDLLHRLGPPRGADSMASFRGAFAARYGDREVPLAVALDEENGIGFETPPGPWADASPLLRGFPFGMRGGGGAAFTARDAHLVHRLADTWRDGAAELELGDADWRAIATPDPAPLPDSFAVMAQLAARDDDALARGEFRVVVEHLSGPSGAILLGRFCHADPALHEHVRAMLRAEEAARPDAIFAEIVHLPEGRIGNIASRPVLRDHEIAYLGASGAPRERQLTIDDLVVRVAGGRVVLRSRRLDREVIPRLANAHNYALRSLGVYRFLCALQRQGVMSAGGWSWGALGGLARLPRVVSGRVVLAQRRWNLDAAALAELATRDGAKRVRERLALPRWIAVADGDNQLPIDLDSELLVDALVQLVKSRGGAAIVEIYPPPDELCAHGPEGRFVHELIVPFRSTASAAAASASVPAAGVARLHAPGSEWLFAKLYAGPATTDRVLREIVAPIVAELKPAQWFFVRFADPDWHVRVRFRGDPAWLRDAVLPRLAAAAAPALDDGAVWKLQLDTYDREIERYGGGDGIVLAERLFHADSEAVLAMLPLFGGAGGADLRWRVALLGMDQLLADLGFALADKLAIARDARAGFGRELGVDTAFERLLGDRFRRERGRLEQVLGGGGEPEVRAALRARSDRVAPITAELRARALPVALPELAAAYLHMHANRVLRASPREHELILYDFLQRLYESQQARAKQQRQKPA